MVFATYEEVMAPLPAVWRAGDLLERPDGKFPDPPKRLDIGQEDNYSYAVGCLQAWFGDLEVLVTGESFVCMTTRPTGDTRAIRPDCLVAFGVSREKLIASRNGYVIGEVGKPPDFGLEIASERTGAADYLRKRAIYMDLGVREVVRFDAAGGALFGKALAGDRLVDGVYADVPTFPCPTFVDDEALHVHSEVLGLDVCWRAGNLRFYDPAAGRHLSDLAETWKEIRAAKARADADRARADAAVEEVRRLRAEIRRLRAK